MSRVGPYRDLQHASGDRVELERDEVRDGSRVLLSVPAALAVASWWQSPGRLGGVLASLASGLSVDLDDLLADVELTARAYLSESRPSDANDRELLDLLAAWAREMAR